MHLAEIVCRRAVAGAVVALSLTRRCPLACAHCSTESGPRGEEFDGDLFTRFVATFTRENHPEFLLLTGGEPLLRPALVTEIAEAARAAGTRTFLLTGMFFARHGALTPAISRAVDAVDHLSASVDVHHETQVSRSAAWSLLRRIAGTGKDVSLHITGTGDDDPYLARATTEARREFADRVPMLVGRLARAGRARTWSLPPAAQPAGPVRPQPCTMAAWPVVGFDGTVTACGNQSVVDHRPLPDHLRLGHVRVDGWPAIRHRSRTSTALRRLRVFGPTYPASPGAAGTATGYCQSCWRLSTSEHQVPEDRLEALDEQVTAAQVRAGAVGFARRYGCARYADLVLLGYRNGG